MASTEHSKEYIPMIQRPERWTESMLRGLEPHEHDFQEFKGSNWLMRGTGEIQADFIYYLSKQVSAFANGSGGLLFIGLNDHGQVDGGVPINLKNGGTRAWLEDLVSSSVDPKIPSCNVFEVCADDEGKSALNPNCAVYVLELPASIDAPHQAKDHRYYLRIAGKSRPMGHVHVQDVLRRTFHPDVEVSRFGPYGEPQFDISDPRGARVLIQFRAFIANRGRTLARHVGAEVIVPRPFAGTAVRNLMKEQGECHYTQTPGELSFFRYHPFPLFPSQEVYGLSVWVCLHRNNISQAQNGAAIEWITYADDARPLRSGHALDNFQVVTKAIEWLASQPTEKP